MPALQFDMQVLEGAVFLCQLLAREFIFAPVSFSSHERDENIIRIILNCLLLDFTAMCGCEDCSGRYNRLSGQL